MSASAFLRLADLSLQVADFNLANLNLNIQAGEYFVLVGPTGAGKTILLEAIAGVHPVSSGAIYLEDQEITHSPPEARRIGFVYQDYALFPHLTVEQNISYGLRKPWWLNPNRAEIKQRVLEISALLKIDHIQDRKPDSLSGGEKQRVAMARALVTRPRILLLDEPLSSLDPQTRELVQIELRRIHEELGTTTLHITHNFDVAAAMADRMAVLIEGEVKQIGTPREIFRQPVNLEVARFVGVRNIFRGKHTAEADGCGAFHLDGFVFASISSLQGDVRASIRPEDILISKQSLSSSARNNFQGKVAGVADRGAFSYITVQLPSPQEGGRNLELVSLITHNAAEELSLEIGLDVFVAFKASALHIF